MAQEQLRSAVSRVADAVSAMERHGSGIRYLRSTLIPVDESVLCLFEATSVEDVAEANRRAGVGVDRISVGIDMPTGLHTASGTSAAGEEGHGAIEFTVRPLPCAPDRDYFAITVTYSGTSRTSGSGAAHFTNTGTFQALPVEVTRLEDVPTDDHDHPVPVEVNGALK